MSEVAGGGCCLLQCLNLSLAQKVTGGGCCLLQCFELVFSCECHKLLRGGCCSVLNLCFVVHVISCRGRKLNIR